LPERSASDLLSFILRRQLVEAISHIPACNYFTVQSPKEFKQLMNRVPHLPN
jgi:hypothetical protein